MLNARHAQPRRELVAASLLNLQEDPDRSLLLAMHAVATTWPLDRTVLPEAENQLHRAILSSHLRLSLSVNSSVSSVAWNPDGRRIALGTGDLTAQVWDTGVGRQLLALNAADEIGVDTVAWSPDGKRLTTASMLDDAAKVWAVKTGKEVLVLGGFNDESHSH